MTVDDRARSAAGRRPVEAEGGREERPFDVAPFQSRLLAWFGGQARDLPWRRTRDPWAILVSEVMLQQTQVPRVLPKYDAFLRSYPDVTSCAAAPAGDVVRHWAGLGYNRRALSLHAAAVAVRDRHAGQLPTTLAELLALPGVGPYTARAILAFAFEDDSAAVVDTNTARVLARAIAGRRLTAREVQSRADALVPPGEAWAWNQAMLDLGATVCTKQRPRCTTCPVATSCSWFALGRPEPDPAVGSAGVSGTQSTFEGSDRQGRGRLVEALRDGPVDWAHVPAVAGWPGDVARAHRVAEALVSDGLAVRDEDAVRTILRLP